MSAISRFTIVTPSYNQAPYLTETIESVLSQEGPFAIEYFIMDGGSTDGSVDIIRSYAAKLETAQYPVRSRGVSLRWTTGRDGGQSAAINKGLRMATGDVCSYINSDDAYPPGTLARVAAAFAQHPRSDFIYGDGEVIDENGRLQWAWLSRPYRHGLLTSYHFAWNAFTNYIMQQATFWRRRVMDRIGYFDEGMHYAMDLEYWVRAGAAGLVLTHVPENLGRFRMIQGTKSLSSPTAFWEDQIELFRRHHGAGSLARYFAYYYYNVALNRDFDFSGAAEEGAELMRRWDALPRGQREVLAEASRRGYASAVLLCALKLQRMKDHDRARMAYEFATARDSRLHKHGLAVLYQARAAIGPGGTEYMDKCWDLLVGWYRRSRIDYRYRELSGR